jgi:Flp pilus assembly protein TadG
MLRLGTRFARRRDERGAVAAEFALLLPLLVIILFAIIEFGIALTRLVTYTGAAREGARYAAVQCRPESSAGCTSSLLTDKVTDAAEGYPITPGPVSVDRDCSQPASHGQPVRVSWPQQIPISVPLLPDMTWNITIAGSFRCE